MVILKWVEFVIAWTVNILALIVISIGVALSSPILLFSWAMDKTFGEDAW